MLKSTELFHINLKNKKSLRYARQQCIFRLNILWPARQSIGNLDCYVEGRGLYFHLISFGSFVLCLSVIYDCITIYYYRFCLA